MKLKMSSLVEDAAGKDGSLVIRRSRSGPVATPRTYPKQTVTARNTAARKNLGTSSSKFTNLTDAQIAAWNAWGAGRTKTNEVNGQKYAQTGINAYNELTTVYKMASPGTQSPALPPTGSFSGGNLSFSMATISGSGDLPNGVLVEVGTMALRSRARRIPTAGFVSRGFFAGSPSSGFSASITVPAGIHAVKVRYVQKASGMTTADQLLGKATVVDGGVDAETGEVMEPAAKPARMKKAA